MGSYNGRLTFDRPIQDIEARLAVAEADPNGSADLVRTLRRELLVLKRDIYARLKPWEIVQIARHPERPQTSDYIDLLFDDFIELHGDRCFGDDRAIVTGLAKFSDYKILFIGHQKGKTLAEKKDCFFGCAHPEGYRKALLKMRLAEKFGLPVVVFIDTPGAYPGIGAEERGEAQAIALNLLEMSRLRAPIICVVIGEGGSGGALGIGVGDRVSMLEFAWYSVISPEGCAGILWKTATPENAMLAAAALRLTSRDLYRLGVVDEVITEPAGGAHRDPREMAATLKVHLLRQLRSLLPLPIDDVLRLRYERFRRMGQFTEGGQLRGASALEQPAPAPTLHGRDAPGPDGKPAS